MSGLEVSEAMIQGGSGQLSWLSLAQAMLLTHPLPQTRVGDVRSLNLSFQYSGWQHMVLSSSLSFWWPISEMENSWLGPAAYITLAFKNARDLKSRPHFLNHPVYRYFILFHTVFKNYI